MRLILFAALVAVSMSLAANRCQAQVGGAAGAVSYYSGTYSYYGAPGYYGTSYGTASFGVPRLTSSFSSPYGGGFGYGYSSSGFAEGKYGVGLWRPGFATTGYVYGSGSSYRTFPASTWPVPSGHGPPFGAYAPAFGPSPIGLP